MPVYEKYKEIRLRVSQVGASQWRWAMLQSSPIKKKVSRSESDLTLCSPRQSSKAVSWCTLNSVEFNSRWIPKRSLCITRYKRERMIHTFFSPQSGLIVCQPATYLSSGKERHGELQQALDLDLHGGQRTLAGCQRLWKHNHPAPSHAQRSTTNNERITSGRALFWSSMLYIKKKEKVIWC